MTQNLIKYISFIDSKLNSIYDLLLSNNQYECKIKLINTKKKEISELKILIEFNQPIIAWRNHDYRWKTNMNKSKIANDYSPKILVLEDGTHVVSSSNIGLWNYNPKHKKHIEWILKSPKLTPVFKYKKNDFREFNNRFDSINFNLKLLFSKDEVPEFSRSKIPFSPIICFTDHCDFDNNKSLIKQLEFFKKNNLKVTKGFFLNHYSKRQDNSSYENDSKVLNLFFNQKNELAYHSLTQSIRKKEDAIKEFKDFRPPVNYNSKTWIDHGYQPYNFTKKYDSNLSDITWGEIISKKGIKNLWTYLDSGTANNKIINQLNPNHFTANQILKYNKDFIFYIRTVLFFSGNENLLMKYKNIAKNFKSFFFQKKAKTLLPLTLNSFKVFIYLFSKTFSKENRKTTFKYAEFAPFIFKYQIGNSIFNMFQTVEVTNFEKTFSKSNLELLCNEKGAIIAHCYFSSPLKHQKGKLFSGENISKINIQNFNYLKSLISDKKIWNPTLNELADKYNENLNIEYVYDTSKQKIILRKGNNNHKSNIIRYVKYNI